AGIQRLSMNATGSPPARGRRPISMNATGSPPARGRRRIGSNRYSIGSNPHSVTESPISVMVSPLRVAITGGTSGLGLALVHELSRRGARVAFVARTRERVDQIARDHPGTHGIVG